MSMETTIKAIEEQQKGNEQTPAWCVGEQLKDILRSTPAAADIVGQDLARKGMGIADCEKKIHECADKHRHGACGFCPPQEADRIIREFYGIGTSGDAQTPQGGQSAATPAASGRVINLLDLM